jgi:hypothetical protein
MREASQSIGLLQQQHDSMLKYIQDYIGKLEKAKQAKQTNEEETAKGIHKGTAGIDEK